MTLRHKDYGDVELICGYSDFARVKILSSGEERDVDKASLSDSSTPTNLVPFNAPKKAEAVNINNCTPDELAAKVKGIGRVFARQIMNARPQVGGYESFAHLMRVNDNLNVNWIEVEQQQAIVFE